jgi:hypothetical protein
MTCGYTRTEALALAFRWSEKVAIANSKNTRKRKKKKANEKEEEGDDGTTAEESRRRDHEMRITLRREAKARAREVRVQKKKQRRQLKLQRKASEEQQRKLELQRERIRQFTPPSIQPKPHSLVAPPHNSVNVAAKNVGVSEESMAKREKKDSSNSVTRLDSSGKDRSINSQKAKQHNTSASVNTVATSKKLKKKKPNEMNLNNNSTKKNALAPLKNAVTVADSLTGKKRDFSQFDMPAKQKAQPSPASVSSSLPTQSKKRKTIQEMLEEKKMKDSGSLFQSFL